MKNRRNTTPVAPDAIGASLAVVDWAATPDRLRTDRNGFVQQMLVLSLLYEEILMPDELLVLSDPISNWFSDKEGRAIWDALAEVRSMTVLTHPLKAYVDESHRELADRYPMDARAAHISTYGTKENKKWFAADVHRAFYSHVQAGILRNDLRTRAVGVRKELEIMPRFVKLLTKILTKQQYQPWLENTFPSLDPADCARFARYVVEPDRLMRDLRESGMAPHSIQQGASALFNRSLAFQAADLFREADRSALHQIIQSAMYAPFCAREDAIGRFGGLVRALPGPRPKREQDIENSDLVHVTAHVNMPLYLPDVKSAQDLVRFANVVADVRMTPAGQRLRRSIGHLGDSMSFDQQKECWSAVASELAMRVANPGSHSISIYKILGEAAAAGVLLHSANEAFAEKPDFLHALLDGSKGGLEHGAAGLAIAAFHKLWSLTSAHSKLQKSYLAFENAVDFRCTSATDMDEDEDND